jgi:hypothetical protein
MSQLVKMKRQANFEDFKRFGAFRSSSNKKMLYSTRSCVNWAFLGTRGPSKRSLMSKKGNLHTNSLNKLCTIIDNWSHLDQSAL